MLWFSQRYSKNIVWSDDDDDDDDALSRGSKQGFGTGGPVSDNSLVWTCDYANICSDTIEYAAAFWTEEIWGVDFSKSSFNNHNVGSAAC